MLKRGFGAPPAWEKFINTGMQTHIYWVREGPWQGRAGMPEEGDLCRAPMMRNTLRSLAPDLLSKCCIDLRMIYSKA